MPLKCTTQLLCIGALGLLAANVWTLCTDEGSEAERESPYHREGAEFNFCVSNFFFLARFPSFGFHQET